MKNSLEFNSKLKYLNRVRKLSRIMDAAFRIPGTKFKIGIDPIIGLVPGAGDVFSTVCSAYIIYLATRCDIPSAGLRKMIFNVGLEFVVGAIPLIGDVFDAFYKSNMRNLAILEQHLQEHTPDNLYNLINLDDLEIVAENILVDEFTKV